MRPDEKRSIEQIRSAIDRGVNYVDTAWPYHGGKSEVILGKALKNGYREKVKLADKLPYWLCKTREDMDYYLDEQLKRLGDTVIDYYLIHNLDGAVWQKTRDIGIIDFIETAKESGKIANIGFSFHGSREDFKVVADGYDWDFCQIQYNILDENDQAGREGLEYAASKGIGVVVMEPLRGGMLAGELPKQVQKIYDKAPQKRSNAEWALRWVWNQPGVVTVLSGLNDEKHIDENIRIASDAEVASLSDEELAIIEEVGDTFREITKVSCTGCQYCMPCPKDINIPFVFSLYNQGYLFNKRLYSRIMYLMMAGGLQDKKPGLASQCVTCGLCVEHCPQDIDVPAEMERIKKEYEGILGKPAIFLLSKAMNGGGRKEKKESKQ